MKICRKIVFLYKNHKLGGSEKRNGRRYFRLDDIRNRKLHVLRDVRSGHNIGDFELDPSDIVKALAYTEKTSFKELLDLHKKYRG